MYLAMGAYIVASCPACLSAEPPKPPDADQQQSETKTAFPTLDILPEGSILQRVKLPRYNKDFQPESLLKADKLTVINNHQIDGKNVTIELYDKEGKVTAHTEMSQAIYNQRDSSLHASEAITLTGEDFKASGSGLIFHWNDKRGFLIGPVTTEFDITPPAPSSAMILNPDNHPLHRPVALTGAVLTLTTSLFAEPPAPLTPAELAELDRLSQASTGKIEQAAKETQQSLSEEKKMVEAADSTMEKYLTGNKQGQLLVTTPAKKTTPPEDAKPSVGAQSPNLVKVECDGGLYFDSDTGVLAYLKNVRLNGFIVDKKSDPPAAPRPFTMTCSDELKVFLNQPAEKATTAEGTPDNTNNNDSTTPAAEGSATKDTDPKATDKEKSLSDSFGEFKRVVATGNVKLISMDENGKKFIATGETASYDAKSGEMILRGGSPRIQYGPNQYLASKAPGQYIRVLKSGKLITLGKWEMLIDTSKAKPKPTDKTTTP